MTRAIATPPDVVFRLLGYGGLGLIGLTGGDWLLLGFAVGWPVLWWRLVRRVPALRAPQTGLGRIGYALECLLVMSLTALAGVEFWLATAVGLLLLTGVTALGGLGLLGPCAVSVLPLLLLEGRLAADGERPDPVAVYVAGMLIFAFLLSLSLLSFSRVRHLDDRHRRAVSESAELRDRNARLARYLPDDVEPLIRERPSRVNPPREQFATVAFVDMVGFVELVASRPLAELVDVVNDFLATLNQLTERRDGRLAKFLGDGLLVYFPEPDGVPEQRWRAAASCARLCLEVGPALDALRDRWRRRGIDVEIRARAGIACGYCAIGDWGGSRRLDYTLIGTPVNLASRLQAAAPPGGILVTAAAAALMGEDESLAGLLGAGMSRTVKGLDRCMVHALGASAKVRANQRPTPRPPGDGEDLS